MYITFGLYFVYDVDNQRNKVVEHIAVSHSLPSIQVTSRVVWRPQTLPRPSRDILMLYTMLTFLKVSTNGIVSFGESYVGRTPSNPEELVDPAPPVLAPFWVRQDLRIPPGIPTPTNE